MEDPMDDNTSGQGERAFVPPEIRRWNWGAFLLNWIWGIGNHTYIELLTMIPERQERRWRPGRTR
jgi:hypothetical protein